MIVITIVAFMIGFMIGRLKINLKLPKFNKVTQMRKCINNKSWLHDKYDSLMDQERENIHYKNFECSTVFVGASQARHNMKIYYQRVCKIRRQSDFIKSRIKEVDTSYYLKFIGKIPEDELKALNRNNKLNKILK